MDSFLRIFNNDVSVAFLTYHFFEISQGVVNDRFQAPPVSIFRHRIPEDLIVVHATHSSLDESGMAEPQEVATLLGYRCPRAAKLR